MGRNVFAYSKVMAFNTSENSDNCVSIDGVLFSKDKKTLLLFPREKVGWCKYEVPDGTEVVATGAFEDGQIDELILPSSLVRIEDYAFWMTKRIITRNIFGCVPRVSCQALIPPVIVGNPFMSPEDIFLSVPKESFDIYCNSSYWKSFYSINGVMGVGVQSLEIVPSSNVWIQNHLLFLESEKEIEKVKIYTIHGICIHNESVNDRKWQVSTAELPTELLLIEVVTADGDKDVFKLTQ